ncbi:MAG: PASTA domain-containing protein [Gemmatimonadota bacterium]|jgi:hypothetical protein|nr:PASTA domain-containing protein [Gemmatimonadota bacterium]
MATYDPNVLDALSLPLGELIASVGRGVAEAQREMDIATISAYQEVYESTDGGLMELQRIGYRPNWYHIPEAEGDIQVALTVSGSTTQTTSSSSSSTTAVRPLSRLKLYAAPVDAGYSSRFNYTVEASSRVKFRIVPVPPSSASDAVRVMPALIGLTLAEARSRLELLGIEATFPTNTQESAVVTNQLPAPGSILNVGTAVQVVV